MPQPRSLALRMCLLEAATAGASRREAGYCYDVSARCAMTWLQRRQETRSVASTAGWGTIFRPLSALCNMRTRRAVFTLTAFISFLCLSSIRASAQFNQTSPLGTNLDAVNYYTTEQPFLNIFKVAGSWTTRNYNGGYNSTTGEETLLYSSFLDSNGYPTTLTGGPAHNFNEVSALIYQGPGINYPSGQYLFLYDGTGTFNFTYDASVASSSPGKIILNVNATTSGILAILTSTDPNNTGNYARNFRLVYCGTWNGSSCSSGYDTLLANGEMFNPNFIAVVKPFKTVRFMWWQETLYDSTTSWANRATPGWVFWDDTIKFNGAVPAEVLFALCNEIGADGWFNMPVLSNDDYVTQFATLAHSSLNSGLKAYVEYGNEIWNNGAIAPNIWSSLVQLGYAAFPGLGTSGNDFAAGFFYGILRAVQNGNTWKSMWGADAGRVIRVAGGQNGYTARNQTILQFTAGQLGGNASLFSGTVAQNVDALATAPYFGYAVPDTFTLDQLFTEITTGGLVTGGYPGGMIKQALDYATADYGVASAASLPLMAYEGGQSLVAPASDTTLQNLYAAANRDPRMGAAYTTFFNGWKSLGGQLFNNYTDVSVYGEYGYWGALEYVSEAPTPKYLALAGFISNNPCWWSGCAALEVLISSPRNGTVLIGHTNLNIATIASAGSISSITIKADSATLQTCTSTTSCSTTWQGSLIAPGTHVISATVSDTFGRNTTASVAILSLK